MFSPHAIQFAKNSLARFGNIGKNILVLILIIFLLRWIAILSIYYLLSIIYIAYRSVKNYHFIDYSQYASLETLCILIQIFFEVYDKIAKCRNLMGKSALNEERHERDEESK